MTIPSTLVCAHRGFSGRHPEMTRAAYEAAMALAAGRGVALSVECDVHPAADGELVCLHDLTVQRTAVDGSAGAVAELTVPELKRVDVGGELLTLAELLELVAAGRDDGVEVSVAIETKHPNPAGAQTEHALLDLLERHPGVPVRVISFSAAALRRTPAALTRTYLVATLEALDDLPAGVGAVGPALALLRAHPDLVAELHSRGLECHVWTVNSQEDIAWCLDRQVDAITTDHPDRVLDMLGHRG